MFAPHSVTLYLHPPLPRQPPLISFLPHVFLLAGRGSFSRDRHNDLQKSGLLPNSDASLFIPFSCPASHALTGQPQSFVPPKQFAQLLDPLAAWTIFDAGSDSPFDCFFVKGRVVLPNASFHELSRSFDDVFRVSSVAVRDFGSPALHHWRVSGVAGG